jgi:hypothetical protein
MDNADMLCLIQTDIFQAYEKDPVIRARFEEAAASELSYSRSSTMQATASPSHSKRPRLFHSKASRENQDRVDREREIEDLLRRRRAMQNEEFTGS